MKRSKLIVIAIALMLVIASCACLAIFASGAADTAKLTVNTGDGKIQVYVGGVLKNEGTSSVSLNVPVGETVKLAVPESETGFLFWTDSALNQCLVNKQAVREYSFTMNSAATYTAWFAPEGESLVIYQNTNDTKQVLATATYGKTAEFTAHLADNALLYGNTFAGWNKTTDAIQADIANGESVIYVEPNYTKINRTHKVTVAGGTINGSANSGEYAYLEKITLTPNTVAGQSFVGWKDSAGNFISNASTLNVWVIADETFTAVFSGTAVTQEPYVHLDVFSTGEKLAESYAKHFVPSGMTLNEYGIVFVKNADYPEEDLVLQNVDGVAVKKSSLPGNTSTGILLDYFVGVETLSVRAYIIYTDASGNEKTLYSDAHYVGGSEEEIISELLTLKHELRVHKDGSFKVLTFSDVQGSKIDPNAATLVETINNIETIVARENPDLVLLLGDNSFAMTSAEDLKTYLTLVMAPVESRQIPWAHIYGNHDDECNEGNYDAIRKAEQQKVYESFPYCISKDVKYGYDGEEIFGVSNHVLPVLNYDNDKIAFNIFGLDSGSYSDYRGYSGIKETTTVYNRPYYLKNTNNNNYFGGWYEYIQHNQVEWYVETSELLQKYNGDSKPIPAMMYFHIPPQETYFAWNNRDSMGLEYDGHQLVNPDTGFVENISCSAINSGLFGAALSRGDVKLMAYGHDHLNDFMVKYNGIKLCYNGAVGTEVYHGDEIVGGRVINFNVNTPDDIETHMSYVIEKTPIDPNSPILDLVIDENGVVSNASTTTNNVVLNEREKGSVSVVTDADLNKKVLEFTGGGAWQPTTSYSLSTAKGDVDADLLNGFTVEAYLKPTATYSSYTGVVDYEESGGFGLVIYEGSDSTKAKITAEIADHSTDEGGKNWLTLSKEVDLGEWYHVVVVYDGDKTATLYINGEVADSGEVVTAMRAPSFSGSDKHICIGSSAQSIENTNQPQDYCGFTGRLSTCKILRTVATADEVKTMYNAVKPTEPAEVDSYILKLDIADDGTVSNAAKNRPTLQSYTGTSGTKTVTSDNSINRKFINFVGGADSNASSTYWMPMTTIPDSELADGFTVEAMFRAPAKPSLNYINIIDYCETGGFGLYYSSDGKLHFDMGDASSYALSSTTINPGEWYHVVATYDSTNLKILIYVNGVKAAEGNVNTRYKAPSFRGTSSDYVCIGAGAQNGTYGDKGFTGDIAIANIHKDTATADQAKAMYDAVMTKILCLNIDATNQTVTNGVETGPVLNEVTHANSSKTITTDSEIGRDIVTFTPRGQWATTDAYTIKTTNVNSDLANGFSFEMYFKIDNVNNLASHYLGILNYEEGGGFGFNLVPCSDSTMTTLSFGFVTDDGATASYSKDVKLGEWVHCVFVYDGPTADTISFYVNGELLGGAKKTLTGDFKLPSSFSTEPFIAIGACADSANTTINGIAGSIAICNIYSNPLTAGQAKVAYNAAIA